MINCFLTVAGSGFHSVKSLPKEFAANRFPISVFKENLLTEMDNGRRTLQKEVLISAENRKTNRSFVVVFDRTGRLWFCLER